MLTASISAGLRRTGESIVGVFTGGRCVGPGPPRACPVGTKVSQATGQPSARPEPGGVHAAILLSCETDSPMGRAHGGLYAEECDSY